MHSISSNARWHPKPMDPTESWESGGSRREKPLPVSAPPLAIARARLDSASRAWAGTEPQDRMRVSHTPNVKLSVDHWTGFYWPSRPDQSKYSAAAANPHDL